MTFSAHKRGFCQSNGHISPPTSYKTAKDKNDGDLRKFVKISFLSLLHDIILAIFENAKNGHMGRYMVYSYFYQFIMQKASQ